MDFQITGGKRLNDEMHAEDIEELSETEKNFSSGETRVKILKNNNGIIYKEKNNETNE